MSESFWIEPAAPTGPPVPSVDRGEWISDWQQVYARGLHAPFLPDRISDLPIGPRYHRLASYIRRLRYFCRGRLRSELPIQKLVAVCLERYRYLASTIRGYYVPCRKGTESRC